VRPFPAAALPFPAPCAAALLSSTPLCFFQPPRCSGFRPFFLRAGLLFPGFFFGKYALHIFVFASAGGPPPVHPRLFSSTLAYVFLDFFLENTPFIFLFSLPLAAPLPCTHAFFHPRRFFLIFSFFFENTPLISFFSLPPAAPLPCTHAFFHPRRFLFHFLHFGKYDIFSFDRLLRIIHCAALGLFFDSRAPPRAPERGPLSMPGSPFSALSFSCA